MPRTTRTGHDASAENCLREVVALVQRGRTTPAPLAVLVVRVRGFARGSNELAEIERAVASACHESDVVARYAAGGFVVASPGSDGTSATALADRIRNAVLSRRSTPTGRRSNLALLVTPLEASAARDAGSLLPASVPSAAIAPSAGRSL